jgi:hypothetical protein
MTASPLEASMIIEVPSVRNFDLVGAGAKEMAADFVDLIRERAARGIPGEVVVQNSR